MGVAVGDFDSDGCVDVFITHFGAPNQLFRNNCDGTFTDVTQQGRRGGRRPVGHERERLSTTTATDCLDLFVTNYVDFDLSDNKRMLRTAAAPATTARRRLYKPVPGILYRNRGDGTFEDVSGQIRHNAANSAAAWASSPPISTAMDGRTSYVANDVQSEPALDQPEGRHVSQRSGHLAAAPSSVDGAPEVEHGRRFGRRTTTMADEDLFITHHRTREGDLCTSISARVSSKIAAPSARTGRARLRALHGIRHGVRRLRQRRLARSRHRERRRAHDRYPGERPRIRFRCVRENSCCAICATVAS